MQTETHLNTETITASENILKSQLVSYLGGIPAVGGAVLGVALDSVLVGMPFSVVTHGIVGVLIGVGGCVPGDILASAGDGRAVKASAFNVSMSWDDGQVDVTSSTQPPTFSVSTIGGILPEIPVGVALDSASENQTSRVKLY